MYYFAYGSNMLTRRLAAPERAPSARAIGIGMLPGRRLRFHKIGLDGSGKCDVELTGVAGDEVYGVVFEIGRRDKLTLDRLECAGGGYATMAVSIQLAGENVTAATYVAQHTSADMLPFDWYKALVIAGALEHELPADYIAVLHAVASIDDPDATRQRQHAELLAADPVQRRGARRA